jgi:hypothetical protein
MSAKPPLVILLLVGRNPACFGNEGELAAVEVSKDRLVAMLRATAE